MMIDSARSGLLRLLPGRQAVIGWQSLERWRLDTVRWLEANSLDMARWPVGADLVKRALARKLPACLAANRS